MEPRPEHLIRLDDLPDERLEALVRRSLELKAGEAAPESPLAGRSIGLLFFRGSLRTRTSLEVAVHQLGGQTVHLASSSDFWNLEERGPLFIAPGTPVYRGMIIGEHARGNDLDVNPLKAKQLTNIRAAGKDEAVRLTPPRPMSLEQAIAYITDDELVEVTPRSLRLRKRLLEPHQRKRQSKLRDAI